MTSYLNVHLFSCMYIFNVVYAEIREDTSYNIWEIKILLLFSLFLIQCPGMVLVQVGAGVQYSRKS